MAKKPIHYYNIEEYKNNKEQYIQDTSRSGLLAGTPSPKMMPPKTLDLEPREEGEPLDSGAGEEAPLGPHNVTRAYITLYVNPNKTKNLAIRVNLTDGESAEFVCRLQKTANLTNYLKYTNEHKECARQWFKECRTYCKDTYGVKPQSGKFHLNTKQYGNSLQSTQIEPLCYGSAVYNTDSKEYVAFVRLYDLWISEEELSSEYLTERQRQNNVRGTRLWINPLHDRRVRPRTFAQRRAGK